MYVKVLTYLRNKFLVASLACGTAFMLLYAVLAQVCVSCPITGNWAFRRKGLKDIGAKTDRGGIQCCSIKQCEKTDMFLSTKALKPLKIEDKVANISMLQIQTIVHRFDKQYGTVVRN